MPIRRLAEVAGGLLTWLASMIPRRRNQWVFGAWFGERFSDNSKYFFLYVCRFQPSIRGTWISSNPEVVRELRRLGFSAENANSLRGWMRCLRAGTHVISNGLQDTNRYLSAGARIVQLWHGIPLKRIGFDEPQHSPARWWLQTFRRLFPHLRPYNYDLVACQCHEMAKTISRAFRLKLEACPVTGSPRLDADLLANTFPDVVDLSTWRTRYPGKRLLLYAPTFRQFGKGKYAPYGFDADRLNEVLAGIDSVLLIKQHPADRDVAPEPTTNVKPLSSADVADIYPLLRCVDLLITDYSSLYFDAMALDIPVVFAPFDKMGYEAKDRGFYYRYEEVTWGKKAGNWRELEDLLREFHSSKEAFLAPQNLKETFAPPLGFASPRIYELLC